MLNLNVKKRPTSRDLLNIKFINLRVRERQERERYNELKRGEEKLKKEQKELIARQKALETRREELRIREAALQKREALLRESTSGGRILDGSHGDLASTSSTSSGRHAGAFCFSNISVESEHKPVS